MTRSEGENASPASGGVGREDPHVARASQPSAVPQLPLLTPELIAQKEAENGLRQFDRMIELIEASIAPGAPAFRLRPSTILELNRIAVDGLLRAPGAYREGSIQITGTIHVPPPHVDVPRHVDEMCEYVATHWTSTPVHLGAYLLWRLNWIHPFNDGNGRTSRAVAYLVLSSRLGCRLPGTNTIPERIAAAKQPYYAALDAADAAWKLGETDVTLMEQLLEEHLAAQLYDTLTKATGKT